jgi:methylmalonyl-CoA mutase N-terminal domain/subunit
MLTDEAREALEVARREYEQKVADVLSRYGEALDTPYTTSGIPLKATYNPDDVAGLDYLRDLGFPGEYPYTRGVAPLGYRTRRWTVRQVMGVGTAEETNQRLKYLIEQGQTGVSLTGMGYAPFDSSDPRAEGLVGGGGVWIDTLDDMETVLDGIDIGRISINQTGNSIPAFCMLIAVAKKRGLPLSELRGTIQNYVLPWGDGPDLRGNHYVDIIQYCTRHLPRWNHSSISVRNTRETGISAAQEMAFGVFQGVYTINALLARGESVDSFAPRISFFLNAENEFLEEVAKFRAMRRMWARLLKQRFGAKDPRSWQLRFHVQTSGVSLTAQQPLTNLVRATVHALAAVMGGAQSMSVNAFDEALATPTAFSQTLSLRTQQIIAFESGVTSVVDPLGGAYSIESLTNELEHRANEILAKLDDMEGPEAFEYISRESHEAAYRRQKAIDAGEQVVVGVNRFQADEDQDLPAGQHEVLEVDPAWRTKQVGRLEKVKASRDPVAVDAAKRRLVEAYLARENILDPTLEAVESYMSVGEMVQTLSAVGDSVELRRRGGFILRLYGTGAGG